MGFTPENRVPIPLMNQRFPNIKNGTRLGADRERAPGWSEVARHPDGAGAEQSWLPQLAT